MRYGERLRTARKARKLTQTQLEEKSGVFQSLISQLENSETATGSEYTVRLARALEVSPDWLADEIGEMTPSAYQVRDPKLIAALQIMQEMPAYGVDKAIKDLADLAELITQARANGANG